MNGDCAASIGHLELVQGLFSPAEDLFEMVIPSCGAQEPGAAVSELAGLQSRQSEAGAEQNQLFTDTSSSTSAKCRFGSQFLKEFIGAAERRLYVAADIFLADNVL
jgi:hypothetical protein